MDRQPALRLMTLLGCLLTIGAGCRCSRNYSPSPPEGPERAKVLVSWTTESSEGLYGFNIYRGNSPEGPWKRVNPTPILAAEGGMTTIRRQYKHVDSHEELLIGKPYWYWLQAVDNDGTKRRVWWPPKKVVPKVRLDEEFSSSKKK